MKKLQTIPQKFLIPDEFSIDKHVFPLMKWDRIFFFGDLWAWKSTFIRQLLRKYFQNPNLIVRSPTYTYYQKYSPQSSELSNIYHFDLYRIDDIETFFSIGGMEILEDPNNIVLIEWPEIIENIITPTKKISIKILEDGTREVTISY